MNDTQTSEPGLINLEEHRRCLEAHEIYMQFKPDDVRRKVFACFEDEIWKKLPSKDQERCIPYWQRNKKDQPNHTWPRIAGKYARSLLPIFLNRR